MKVTLRKFNASDIPNKVRWINDPRNNTFLHYDLPLEVEKTQKWYENVKDRTDRYDAIIEVDGIPVGLIGLLCIDLKNKKAEYYVSMGEHSYKGKGIAYEASKLILEYAFCKLNINKVYLNVDSENIAACGLYEKIGFICEGVFKQDLWHHGKFIDRKRYAILCSKYLSKYENIGDFQNV